MAKQIQKPDSTTSTIDRFQANRATKRCEAAKLYRELLLRNESPKPSDAQSLNEVMEILGRHPDDLAADIGTVRGLIAAAEALQRSKDLAGPLEEAKRALRETKDRVAAERVAFEARVHAEVNAAHNTFAKLASERASLSYAAGQAPTDAWTAIVEGISVDEAREARRAALRRTTPTPPPVTRDQIVEQCRHELVVQRYVPLAGTIIEYVNGALGAAGFEPLTDSEIGNIEGWGVGRPH
jgi:hypothetical protein